MPIAFLRNGVCVPLVTDAHRRAVLEHGVAVPGDAAVRHLEADEPRVRRRPPSARAARSAPMNDGLFQPTIQPSPASSGVVVSSMSWP